jgi:hypothetical protein
MSSAGEGPPRTVPDLSDCEIAPRAAVPSRQARVTSLLATATSHARITEQSGDLRAELQFLISCLLRDETGTFAVDVDSQVIAWFANAE